MPASHGDGGTWKREPREAAARYADEWIVGIEDVTPLAAEIHALVREGEPDRAAGLLPEERPYPLDDEVLAHLRA